ncbi:Protein of unknown function [Bacillus thuringiensis]|uniref:Uncharacterized protein n=1 Tax=Bacillus thuringiensis TaxID=1428 RepID=A0A1C4EGP2_BACTU|nr:Protein of unknown function [Bacillus thuringiensis]
MEYTNMHLFRFELME